MVSFKRQEIIHCLLSGPQCDTTAASVTLPSQLIVLLSAVGTIVLAAIFVLWLCHQRLTLAAIWREKKKKHVEVTCVLEKKVVGG